MPAGDSPLELPRHSPRDAGLGQKPWQTGPEIEAIGLDGKPVKLTDFRGKVVVLMFCVDDKWKPQWFELLSELRKRFVKQPLEILALHDASVTSVEAFGKAATAIRDMLHVDQLPFHLLFDRPLEGGGTGPYRVAAGVRGAGRSFDQFEVVDDPTTLVIDAKGKLVFASRDFGIGGYYVDLTTDQKGNLVFFDDDDELEGVDDGHEEGTAPNFLSSAAFAWALEDQFGMPRSRVKEKRAEPEGATDGERTGRYQRPGGRSPRADRCIQGTKVSPGGTGIREKNVRTDTDGRFKLTAENIEYGSKLEVECRREGLARHSISKAWPLSQPPDINVYDPPSDRAGHYCRHWCWPGGRGHRQRRSRGEDDSGITLGLRYAEDGPTTYPPRTFTLWPMTPDGFSSRMCSPDREFWVYAALGSLADDGTLVHRLAFDRAQGARYSIWAIWWSVKATRSPDAGPVTSDGQHLPAGATLWAQSLDASGDLPSELDEQGRFQIHGLPDGIVFVSITFPSGPAVSAYRLSSKNKCLDPGGRRLHLVGRSTGDIGDLTILLEPGPAPPEYDIPDEALDPALVADYKTPWPGRSPACRRGITRRNDMQLRGAGVDARGAHNRLSLRGWNKGVRYRY